MNSGMLERSQVVPNIYQSFYKDGDNQIVHEADERYLMNLSAWQLFFYEQLIDRKVYLGDQRYLNLYSGLSYEHQKFIFNNSMPVVNMVCGRQRQYRKATQIMPVHGASDKTASQATKAIQSAYYIDDTYNTVSSCFKEAAGITGLSLMHSWIDYRKDPICGDLRTECLSADMLMMDAFWRQMDLSDCQFIRTRKYLHKEQVKQLIPGREKDIDLLNDQAYFDTKFTFMPQQYNIRRKGFLAYDEYWYMCERMGTFIVDPNTYESVEVEFDKEDLANLKNRYPDIVVVREKIPTVHLAIIVNNTCFYNGPNPLGIDCYPFTPFVGYHDLANNNYAFRYQGIIRNIRDSQYLYNYRKQLELDLLAAQFSGVDVEEDALISDDDAFKVGPGKVRFFKKGRLQALVDKPGANINPANYQATQFLKEDIQSNAGVTPELLGQAEDSDVGITEQLRQGAALTTLQELFDNLNLSQRNAGRLHWALIQKNYTEGKIRRMIQEDPTNEFRDKSFQKYDAVIANAQLTDTTKQLAFAQKYTLWKDGLPIPVEQLLADVTLQDKDKLIESIQQQQQAQQQQQEQMAQLQMENQRIVNESLQSKAMSDRALAEERVRKGELEQFQIKTAFEKAEHEKAAATYNAVKAAKEVESMGVDDFVKIFTLIKNISNNKDKELNKQGVSNGTQS
jgi:hypothetical protein